MRPSLRNRSLGYLPLQQHEEETQQQQHQQQHLQQQQQQQQRHDPRFDVPPEEPPRGAIALAIFLTLFGAVSLVLAWLHFTQVIFGKAQAEIGFTIVGLLTLIPGSYHSWIALCVWRGVPGYSWADIPR